MYLFIFPLWYWYQGWPKKPKTTTLFGYWLFYPHKAIWFWGKFYKNDISKLEDLTDCLIYELRSREVRYSHDDELLIRLGFSRLMEVIQMCSAEDSSVKHIEKLKNEKIKARRKGRMKNI